MIVVLSVVGWINGITCCILVFSTSLLGLFFVYKAIKTKAKLLFYAGLTIAFIYMGYLGGVVDFFTILLTGVNNEDIILITFIGMFLISIGMSTFVYILATFLFPKRKKIIALAIFILYSLWMLFILLDPLGSVVFIFPKNPGEDLIDYYENPNTINGFVLIIIIIYGCVVLSLGLPRLKTLEPIPKKKIEFLYLFAIIHISVGGLESYFEFGPFLILIRIVYISSIVIWYFAMREERVKVTSIDKRVKVEGGLFRVSEVIPGNVTEEQVMFHKQQKICLVCKGKILRTNYLCPQCDALYCNKCSAALSDAENACWVCNAPFDEKKPSMPFKQEPKEEPKVVFKK